STITATTESPNMIKPWFTPSYRVLTLARLPVMRPATYIAMMVRIIAQIAMPTFIPVTGCGALGLAALANIAIPSIPNTDQIATKLNTPAQIADQLSVLTGPIFTVWYPVSAISFSSFLLSYPMSFGQVWDGRSEINIAIRYNQIGGRKTETPVSEQT